MKLTKKTWLNSTEDQNDRLCEHQSWPTGLVRWAVKEDKLTRYQKHLLCEYQSWPTGLVRWAIKEDKLIEYQVDLLCEYQSWTADLIRWAIKEDKLTKVQKNLLREYQVKITPRKAIFRAQQYAKRYGLEIKDGCLLAYRDHDKLGRGQYYRNRYYRKGQTYTDWHCDPRAEVENSFGLGIWPQGNTLVSVPLEKFGVEVNRADGKARVWEFTVISCSRTL